MKITGAIQTSPGDLLVQSDTPKLDSQESGAKVLPIEPTKNPSQNKNSFGAEVKQGLARVFERIKLVSSPPNPYDKNDRRRRALNIYRLFNKGLNKTGKKLNTAV